MTFEAYLDEILDSIKDSHNYTDEMEVVANALAKEYYDNGVSADKFISKLVNDGYAVYPILDIEEVIDSDILKAVLSEFIEVDGDCSKAIAKLSDSDLREFFGIIIDVIQNDYSLVHSEFDGINSFIILEK